MFVSIIATGVKKKGILEKLQIVLLLMGCPIAAVTPVRDCAELVP